MYRLAALMELPAGVIPTVEAISRLDGCLRVGLSRLGADEHQGLAALAAVFEGTPLQAAAADFMASLQRREYTTRLVVHGAALRAALHGALHDALLAKAADVLGRKAPSKIEAYASNKAAEGASAVWRDSVQHWLLELAQTGFQHLDRATIAPFATTLQQLQDEPAAAGWAALLTGFYHELLHALPIAALPTLPICRWADLWTRSAVLSLAPAGAESPARRVSGNLMPLGVDVRRHGCFVSFVIYAGLETDGETRIVRMPLSSYKVDALRGEETWRCLDSSLSILLQALSERSSLSVSDATLLASGDLLIGPGVKKGKAFDLMPMAARCLGPESTAEMPTTPPLHRHPVQLALPFHLDGVRVENVDSELTLNADGVRLPMVRWRLGAISALGEEHLAKAKTLIGLLRFDGGRWQVQPLAVDTGGKKGVVGVSDLAFEAATKKRKDDTLKILRERASRLLRKKP